MKKLAILIFLMSLCFGGSPFSAAQTHNNSQSQAKEARKMEKKQQKAQKKYAKAQKKAQRKMEKYDRKHTHDPNLKR